MAVDSTAPRLRRRYEDRFRDDLEEFFRRLGATVQAQGGFHVDTFESSLEGLIFSDGKAAAEAFGRRVFDALSGRSSPEPAELRFDPDLLDPWIDEVAGNSAESIIAATVDGLDDAYADDDPDAPDQFLDGLVTVAAGMYAVSMTTTFANFGAHDGARAGGARAKVWRTNSGNPRSSHAALDGMQIGMDEMFPTGQRWPGDPAGGVEEVAGCMCSLEFAA